ncbi:hypothetical protein ABK040_013992 [Willaertia magna]
MCGGCYVPPFLIPLVLLFDLTRKVKEFAQGVDDKIRNNNQKIKEQVQAKRYEHTKCNEKELELNKAIEGTNDGNERKDLLFKRAIVRIEAERYENALEDLLTIKEVFEDNHIFHYVLGKALEGKSEYKEAANSMLKAIEKMELLSEDECLKLENGLVQTQLETKHTIERGLIKAFGAFDKLKSSYFVQEEKPKTSINLELLYMNAGVCYNLGAFYEDAIKMFSKAIELGERYSSSYVVLNYYNRGLCYYYTHDLDCAEKDFTKVIEMNHLKIVQGKEDPYKMRALVYGRKGMIKNMNDDNSKAKLINPFTKFVTVFHHRLLDEDTTNIIFSFLELKDLLIVGSTGKYWRGLAAKIISSKTIHLSVNRIMPNAEQLKTKRTLLESIFLPKNEGITGAAFFAKTVLHHSMLCNYAKSIIIYASYYSWATEMMEQVLKNFKAVDKLVCYQYAAFPNELSNAWKEFAKHCKLTSLTFMRGNYDSHYGFNESADECISLFKDTLEHLSIADFFLSNSDRYYDQFKQLKTIDVIVKSNDNISNDNSDSDNDNSNDNNKVEDTAIIERKILKYSTEYPTIQFNIVKSKVYFDYDPEQEQEIEYDVATINYETDM